jgi:hypothetical protein
MMRSSPISVRTFLGDFDVDPGGVAIDVGVVFQDFEGRMVVADELHMGGHELEVGVFAGDEPR